MAMRDDPASVSPRKARRQRRRKAVQAAPGGGRARNCRSGTGFPGDAACRRPCATDVRSGGRNDVSGPPQAIRTAQGRGGAFAAVPRHPGLSLCFSVLHADFPRSTLKYNIRGSGCLFFRHRILHVSQMAATVPVVTLGDRHAKGLPPPDPGRTVPDLRAEEKRAFGTSDRTAAGPRPDDGLARGAPERAARRREGKVVPEQPENRVQPALAGQLSSSKPVRRITPDASSMTALRHVGPADSTIRWSCAGTSRDGSTSPDDVERHPMTGGLSGPWLRAPKAGPAELAASVGCPGKRRCRRDEFKVADIAAGAA